MTGLAEILYYLRQTLGGFYAELFIGIVVLIVGITLGSLLMFWLVAFVSTRIRRDNDFPLKDHITTLGYEISGKRYTKAPHAKTVKESMVILLDAILCTLFKRKTVHYKSATKSRVTFYTVAGLVMLLTLGSFVSTSDAFMGGVKTKYHQYIVMGQQNTKKNNPVQQQYHLASVQTVHETAPAAAPEKTANTTSTTQTTQADPKHDDSKQVHQPETTKKHTTGSNHEHQTVAERTKVSENRKETGHKSVKHLTVAKRPIKRVEVDGHPVAETDDDDKIAGLVKGAVQNGAKEIRITVKSIGGLLRGQDNNNQ